MSVWRWADQFAPPVAGELCTSLGEGGTPCVPSRSIGPSIGLPQLHFKLETVNPSGSYKDRFAALATSHMRANEQHTCLATSSGNTGASLAAYCAAADIRCQIAVVETAPDAKLQQMMAYGAEIQRVHGFGVDAAVTGRVFEHLLRRSESEGFALQVSAYRYSPLGMQGVESISYELDNQFAGDFAHVFCPAGGGGLTLAVACGFHNLNRRAAVHCVQPDGNDTIAGPLRNGLNVARDVECETTISGLQVANVIDGNEVIAACRSSGGTGHTVSDDAVFAAQRRLAREEGIFCEPAGAVALAGVINTVQQDKFQTNSPVVCLVTGSGFKDAHSVERMNADRQCPWVDLNTLFVE